jgi:hypothetical protein
VASAPAGTALQVPPPSLGGSSSLDGTGVLSGLFECWLATSAPVLCDCKLKVSCPAGDYPELVIAILFVLLSLSQAKAKAEGSKAGQGRLALHTSSPPRNGSPRWPSHARLSFIRCVYFLCVPIFRKHRGAGRLRLRPRAASGAGPRQSTTTMESTQPSSRKLCLYRPRISPTCSLRPRHSRASVLDPDAQGIPPFRQSFSNKVRGLVVPPSVYCLLRPSSCSAPSRTKSAPLSRITFSPREYDDLSPLHRRYIEKRAVCPIAIQTTVYLYFSSGSQLPFSSTTVATPRSTGIPGDDIDGLLNPGPGPNAAPTSNPVNGEGIDNGNGSPP